MATTQMTEKRAARFDVRKYDERLTREQRQILADTENVSVTIIYPLSELPDQYKNANGTPDDFVRVYKSKKAQEMNEQPDMAAVKFKIGANCKWFNKYGEEVTRPTNEYLDKVDAEVQICYTRKERSATKPKSPCGYWANGIMYRETSEAMFAGMAFETMDAEPEKETQSEQTKAEEVEQETEQQQDIDLPF